MGNLDRVLIFLGGFVFVGGMCLLSTVSNQRTEGDHRQKYCDLLRLQLHNAAEEIRDEIDQVYRYEFSKQLAEDLRRRRNFDDVMSCGNPVDSAKYRTCLARKDYRCLEELVHLAEISIPYEIQ